MKKVRTDSLFPSSRDIKIPEVTILHLLFLGQGRCQLNILPNLGGCSQVPTPRHSACPHYSFPCFQRPTGRKHPFLQKTGNLSLHKLLFFPSFGAGQLQPAPASGGDVAEPEGRLSDPDDVPYNSFCNYTKQTCFSLCL